MASESLCVSSQKGSGFCGESKIHNKIDHVECQSSFSCSYEDPGKSCPQEIDGTLCYNEIYFREDLFKTNNDPHCNAGRTCPDTDDEPSNTAQLQQNTRQQKGSTLQDLYMQDQYDDEDDDDSDWEPVNHFIIKKWFCSNCTMPNFDDVCHCDVWYFSLIFFIVLRMHLHLSSSPALQYACDSCILA